jgi:hypothetical protein
VAVHEVDGVQLVRPSIPSVERACTCWVLGPARPQLPFLGGGNAHAEDGSVVVSGVLAPVSRARSRWEHRPGPGWVPGARLKPGRAMCAGRIRGTWSSPGCPSQGAGAGTRPARRGRDNLEVRASRSRARAQGPGLNGGDVMCRGPGRPKQGAGAGTRPDRRGRDVKWSKVR